MPFIADSEVIDFDYLYNQGNFKEAERLIQKLENKYPSIKLQPDFLLFKIKIMNGLRNTKLALKLSNNLLRSKNLNLNCLQDLDLLIERAISFIIDKKFDKSLEVLKNLEQKVNENRKEKNIEKREGYLYYYLGVNYHSKRESERGLEFVERSLMIFQKNNYNLGIAFAKYYQGIILHETGKDIKKALAAFQDSLTQFRKAGNHDGICKALYNLGWTYRDIGKYNEALNYTKENLLLRKKLDLPREIAWGYISIGWVYSAKEDFNQAIVNLQKGLEIFKKIKEKHGIAFAHYFLALTHKENDKFSLALIHFKNGLILFKNMKNNWISAICLTEMGDIYHKDLNYKESLKSFKQALELFEKLRRNKQIAIVLFELIKLSLDNLEEKKAGIYFDKLATLKESIIYDNRIEQIYNEARTLLEK